MIVGALLIGTFLGTLSGLVMLIFSSSVWMAFLAYAGVGALGTFAFATVVVLRGAHSDVDNYAVRQKLSSLQRG